MAKGFSLRPLEPAGTRSSLKGLWNCPHTVLYKSDTLAFVIFENFLKYFVIFKKQGEEEEKKKIPKDHRKSMSHIRILKLHPKPKHLGGTVEQKLAHWLVFLTWQVPIISENKTTTKKNHINTNTCKEASEFLRRTHTPRQTHASRQSNRGSF